MLAKLENSILKQTCFWPSPNYANVNTLKIPLCGVLAYRLEGVSTGISLAVNRHAYDTPGRTVGWDGGYG